MLTFLPLLCLFTSAFAGIAPLSSLQKESRLINGYPTSITNYPYQVSIAYNEEYVCGGSIISYNFVLTSGHCTTNSISGYTVRAGSSYADKGGTVYGVAAIIGHPLSNASSRGYDAALVRISGSFFFLGGSIKAVDLPSRSYVPSVGSSAVVTGWDSDGDTASSLKYLSLFIVSNTVCMSIYGNNIISSTICAGTSGGICNDDSGNPLVSGGVQVGITSWGNDLCQRGSPAFFTNVGSIRSWITSNTGI